MLLWRILKCFGLASYSPVKATTLCWQHRIVTFALSGSSSCMLSFELLVRLLWKSCEDSRWSSFGSWSFPNFSNSSKNLISIQFPCLDQKVFTKFMRILFDLMGRCLLTVVGQVKRGFSCCARSWAFGWLWALIPICLCGVYSTVISTCFFCSSSSIWFFPADSTKCVIAVVR